MASQVTATPAQRQIKLRRGIAYSRSYTYTEYDSDGVQVVLSAADYTAQLVIRKRFDAPTPILNLTSSPAAGLTLSTVSGSVRITVFVASTATAALPVGSDWKYTLALTPIATPTAVKELVTDDASASDTAL